jgi:hypothetical protein
LSRSTPQIFIKIQTVDTFYEHFNLMYEFFLEKTVEFQ